MSEIYEMSDVPQNRKKTAPTAPIPSEVGPEVVERLRASHAELLERIERDQCEHENTYRGGSIWTICEDCGETWADDRGGFQPYVAPDWLVEARAIVALLDEATVTKTLKVAPEQFAENAKSTPITLTDDQAKMFRGVLGFVYARQGPFAAEAAACLALLPEPVDADLVEAIDLLDTFGDALPDAVSLATAAIKRGRQLSTHRSGGE